MIGVKARDRGEKNVFAAVKKRFETLKKQENPGCRLFV